MNKIPFSPPRIDDKIIHEVVDTLKSGWITTGPKTKQLEKEVAQITGSKKVFCVNSATAGMELMLRWWGVQEGDEVIVPAYTYCATANVVMHCGATPIMVDVNPEDASINIAAVQAAITPQTKAIMPVDLGGMPIDYQALNKMLATKEVQSKFQPANPQQTQLGRLLVLTDAAHSIGAKYQDQAAATWPDAAVFSFHAVKNLTTAEGGAICMNLPDGFDLDVLYKQLNTSSLHGQSKDALAKFGKNSWEYDVTEPGFKCNMPDVLASIGLVEIKRYMQDTLPRRQQLFQAYLDRLSKFEWAELPIWQDEKRSSSAHLFLLRIKDITLEQRNAIIQHIFDQGVSVNVHYKPLPLLSFYKNLGYQMSDYPVSKDWWERVITLPLFYDLTEAQIDRVVGAVVNAVEKEMQLAQ